MIKLYVKDGMVVEKLHAVLSYEQKLWLKAFFDFNETNKITAQKILNKDLPKYTN